MIYLTIAGLRNQKAFQIFFTVTRVLTLSLMFGTSIYSLAADVLSNLEHYHEVPFSLTDLFLCVPMIKFTFGFQGIIPTALKHLRNKKENANLVIVLASLVATILAMVIGLATSSALKGYKVPILSTLAWRGYDAGITPRPFWTYAVEYIIIIFPALNVLTTCPPTQSLY
jgi:amino acid permease